MRAAQRTFVGLLSACCETDEVVAVSMISRNWQAPVGQLQSLDLNDIYFAFEDIYGHHYFGSSYWIALGLDVSLNDDARKGHGVFWQVQFYGVASVYDQGEFADAVRKNFHETASETVKRPVHVKACDGTAKALSSALKTNFVKRIAYRGEGITRTGEPRKCWRTRKVSLKAKQEVELRLWLDHIGLGGRVLISPWVIFL